MLQRMIIIGALLFSSPAFAEPERAKVGDALPTVTLSNQHGKAVVIADDVKTVLYVGEMSVSKVASAFFNEQEADFLTKHQAYYIADISGMPSIITKMFAIPKMKKRPYDILLVKEEKDVALIPRKEDSMTVIKVKEGLISSVDYVKTGEELAKVF
ncbi:MAG: FAD/FMN-containing dehydrogenases [uncultured Thiotrichaceae bacterium]|uniref:FAD/FMN-containing dehydrogenases n=1 Tax=uncultured Thiotrichaceae bacterium TaxID=298394 RepID=A0A6S6SJ24_9GAMM|nr:MAG: FAD/FMN-containing dehydrogenases [uncultured Thiotrichaceae bacterium]